MIKIPSSFFLTNGIGVHRERLTAFELALRDGDIEQQNLVSISSILPPSRSGIERQRAPIAATWRDHLRRHGSHGNGLARPSHSFQHRLSVAVGSLDVWLYFGAPWLWNDARAERRLCRGPRSVNVSFHTRNRVRLRRRLE